MSDAMELAEKITERDGTADLEAIIDAAPVDSVRIDMADGSRLGLVSNHLGTRETTSVTCARLTSRGWELEDPDAAYVWRVHPAGSDERPGLMSAETEEG